MSLRGCRRWTKQSPVITINQLSERRPFGRSRRGKKSILSQLVRPGMVREGMPFATCMLLRTLREFHPCWLTPIVGLRRRLRLELRLCSPPFVILSETKNPNGDPFPKPIRDGMPYATYMLLRMLREIPPCRSSSSLRPNVHLRGRLILGLRLNSPQFVFPSVTRNLNSHI